jgi:uncharacterized Zn finger protein
MSNEIRLKISCPNCGREYNGKTIIRHYVKYCSNCGYNFDPEGKDKENIEDAIWEVRFMRNFEKELKREIRKAL